MELLSIVLSFAPVLVIFGLLLVWRMAADVAGAMGWLVAAAVACLWFHTAPQVVLAASLAGLVASLPIALVMAASIVQISVMAETGAVARVVAFMKTVTPGDQITQLMLINVGFGTLLTSLGAVTVSILPPIMLALGYSTFAAIMLPAIGYDALCTYALLGIPAVVFANFVGLPVDQVGIHFAQFMPVISTCIALSMLLLVGGVPMVRRGLPQALIAGLTAGFVAIGMARLGLVTITGIAAGLGVVLALMCFQKLRGRVLIDRSALSPQDIEAEGRLSLGAAASPWILLTVMSLVVNAPFLPFFDLTFKQWSMPVTIIPGAPERIRLFWQAYFWVLVCTALALPLLKPTPAQLVTAVRKSVQRIARPLLSASIFFAIAYVMNHSGKNAQWVLAAPADNMVYVMADASARAFGTLYPLVVPFLGLLGGFISGSETSAIAMLTKLHLATAGKIGADGVLLAAASGIGGGLASVISPAKLQNAAASIDRIGDAAQVIRPAFIISLLLTAVCAVMTLLLAY